MFCDLVSATELSARLDPEDLRDVIRGFQRVATEAIERYDGHVAQHLGDGLLVYFGYPKADEHDAARAGLAALAVVDSVRALNETLQRDARVKLQVRIGLHTGATVIGSVGQGQSSEHLAIGETPNFAARLQGCAEPDTVVVSAETERLLRREFRCQSLGPVQLKGFEGPREVFQLVASQTGGELALARTPFVGREAEISALTAVLEQACGGAGRSVLIRGDAGVGKSRICGVLSNLVAQRDGVRELSSRGSTFFAHTPLRPIASLVAGLVGIGEEDSTESRAAKLSGFMEDLGPSDPLAVALLSPLAGLEAVTLELTPQVRKGRTLATLVEIFVASARRDPMVIVVEDLHWVDESTLEFIGTLSESIADVGLLLVLTARSHFRAPWDVQTEIALHRLSRAAIEEIVNHATGGSLPDDLVSQILLKADGNPLFAEELGQMVAGSGLVTSRPGDAKSLAIPATLKDSLMARLDRLSPTRKSLVQLCATIGRRFSEELLREILRSFEEEMQNEVRRLTDGELLYQRGAPPRSLFVFRHALLQDAAYDSLLRRTRRRYHGRVADVLLERFPNTPPEVCAHHLTEANRQAEAVDLWHAAGGAALSAFALGDSMSHLGRGLACLEAMPNDNERLSKELTLRGTLGVPLMLTQGFAAPDVHNHYSRMLELCERAGDSAAEQVFHSLWGLWTFYIVSGQHPQAKEVAEKLRGLGERTSRSAIILAGHTALGGATLMLGELADARRSLESGLEVYDREEHSPLAMLFGQDAGAMCHSFLTWAHMHAGDDAAAERSALRAEAHSESLGQPSTSAFVDTVLATWSCLAGDAEAAVRYSERGIALAADQGMPHWDAQASITRGWALALSGRGEEGIDGLRGGIAGLTGMGSMATMTLYWAGLAEAELAAGRLDEARAVVDGARAYMGKSQERLHETGLAIIDGRVAAASGDPAEARRIFSAAIAAADARGMGGMSRRAQARLDQLE